MIRSNTAQVRIRRKRHFRAMFTSKATVTLAGGGIFHARMNYARILLVMILMMQNAYPISQIATLLADPARGAILMYLLGGRAVAAGELCRHANISAQSGSAHLSKLVDGGLLTVRKQGRSRYFQLTNSGVANLLEAFGAVATRPLSPPARSNPLRFARTCYDHLAGALAVELTDTLEKRRILVDNGQRGYRVTKVGREFFGDLGMDLEILTRKRRAFSLRCLDWTERRPHLAGSLGAGLLDFFVTEKWIVRLPGTRAVRLTQRGRIGFQDLELPTSDLKLQ